MKTKEIHSILGVAPATFFDWNKTNSKKKRLAKLLKELDTDTVLELLKKAKNNAKKPNMLLYTVNQSIGDKSGVLEIPCQSDKISRRIDNEREFRH